VAGSFSGRPATILVVEDDEQVRALVRSVLKQGGYEVLEASTGAEGLEIVRARGADIALVISDMLLPEVSGSDLADEVRARFPNMPLLLMTGYVEGEIVQRSVGEHHAVFLDKPFSPASLLEKVRGALAQSATATR
jgi:CheY-like chemotaxis protein